MTFLTGWDRTAPTPARLARPRSAEEVTGAVIAGLCSHAEVVRVPGRLRAVFAVMRTLPRAIRRRTPC